MLLELLLQIRGIAIALLIFILMMFIHEMGHFLVGLWCGMKIEEFSIFMGPRIFSFTYKGIQYSLKCIPIGASVRFAGELEDDEEEKNDEEIAIKKDVSQESTKEEKADKTYLFYSAPPFRRILTALAGPFANFLSALLVLILFFANVGGAPNNRIEEIPAKHFLSGYSLPKGTEIVSINQTKIHNRLDLHAFNLFSSASEKKEIQEYSLLVRYPHGEEKILDIHLKKEKHYFLGLYLEATGKYWKITGISNSLKDTSVFQKGDILLSMEDESLVNQDNLDKMHTILAKLDQKGKKQVTVKVLREGNEIILTSPFRTEESFPDITSLTFGKDRSLTGLVKNSSSYLVSLIKLNLHALKALVLGQLNAKDNLMGPVGLVSSLSNISNEAVSLLHRLQKLLLAFVSISVGLGVANLIPIPPLDGFIVLSSCYEWIRKKPLSLKWRYRLQIFGVILMLLLFLLILFFDLSKLLG